jgi:hypothetical protein
LGNDFAQAVAEAEAEASDDADGFAELAIVVGVIVFVLEKEVEVLVVMGVSDAAKVLLDFDATETTVVMVGRGVAYGGAFKFGVAVGQSFSQGFTNMAPLTWAVFELSPIRFLM